MTLRLRFLFLSLFAIAGLTVSAGTLPGFRVETLARADGFVSSIVTDSQGTIYFTTTEGWIYRVDGVGATKIASLPTHAGGNGGLLGMALIDDNTAAVHYTTWDGEDGDAARVLDDVIARVDLASGAETVLTTFVCDINRRERGASSEHHGGNPTVAPDGSIFVGIGEYGGYILAQKTEWNGGKIWRINPNGTANQWALGLRNPYDLAFDPELGRLVVADNGPNDGDEIHIVEHGTNCGWPYTFGNEPPVEGATPPVYVFPHTVAPTGLARLTPDANDMLRRGYLAGAFVTRAIYYFPNWASPIPLLDNFDEYVIDVTQAPNGDILFASAGWTGSAIHRLTVPLRGDCNGDGFADARDLLSMTAELADGAPHPMVTAQDGDYRGSWGCDANADGEIDGSDFEKLRAMLTPKHRAVRK